MHILNIISIKAYLAKHNIHPVKESAHTALYQSPLRADANASFKVDLEKNIWIDYGTNEGGTLIDLVMRLKRCSTYKAMLELGELISVLMSV